MRIILEGITLLMIKIPAIVAAISVLMVSSANCAEELHDREGERSHHEEARHETVRDHHAFAVRDVHRFSDAELGLWRSGRWNQTCFQNRCGWWWLAEGQWFFYDSPVYPYPLRVSEVTYIDPIVVPNTVVPLQNPVMVPQIPVMVAPPSPIPVQPPTQIWYFCASLNTYYPYVPSCPEGWQSVYALPPQ
jgi:hypothetical protein